MKFIFLFSLFAVGITFGSCKKDGNTASYPVEMRMTDAAGPYEAVLIDVQSVEVNGNDGNDGWTALSVHPGIYDLTHLTNGIDTLLGTGTLTNGNISQIRLILGANNSVKLNGQTYALETPSAQQSGLKLNVHETLTNGITYKILLDFDAAKSIVEKGNGKYSLKPVIRTIVQSTSGAIKGMVTPAASKTTVHAVIGQDTIGALTDVNGNFLVRGAKAGTYTVLFTPIAPYMAKTVSGVSVTNGNVTDMGPVAIQ